MTQNKAYKNILKILIIALLILSSGYFLYNGALGSIFNRTSTNLNDGLVGHWTFDGKDMYQNIADASGNGNNGMLNGQTATTSVRGKIGQALEFDGTNDYVKVNDFTYSDNISISFWMYLRDVSQIKYIVSKRDSIATPNDNEWAVYLGSDSKLKFIIWDSSNTANGSASSDNILNANQWYHITTTVDGSNLQIYVDGVASTPQSQTVTRFNNTADVTIARCSANAACPSESDRYFDGVLDDVRIYNRALSATEITRLYNIGAGSKAQASPKNKLTDGLVGYWTFDGKDMYQNIADVSGNGNTGYLQGQTSTSTTRGKIGQALSFDGVDDYVGISTINMASWNSLTVSAWAYYDSSGTDEHTIVNNWDKFTTKASALLRLEPTNDTVEGFVIVDIDTQLGGSFTDLILTPNQWSLVTMTYDTTNGLQAYLNGTKSTTSYPSSALLDATASLSDIRIGDTPHVTRDRFTGSIDDVRIYNRALSATEITRLYNIGAGSKAQASPKNKLTDGLVGYWTFDGKDMYQNIADVSGNGNTGYLQEQTSTSTTRGKIGQALNFDGIDDIVGITGSSGVGDDLDLLSNFSISTWVNISSLEGTVVAKRDGSFNQWQVYIGSDKKIYVRSDNTWGSTNAISANQWYNIVVLFGTAGTEPTVYVNGVQWAGNGVVLSPTHLDVNVSIGARWNGYPTTGYEFGGSIDDVRIYNKVLSQSEITRLYNMGR